MSTLLDPRERQALIERLRTVSHDASRRWGTMDAPAMVCHLSDAMHMMLGEHPCDRTGNAWERTFIRFIALHTPVPWPKGIKGPESIEQGKGGTAPADFDADRERLVSLIERFVSSIDPSAMIHPYFGRITEREWGIWGYRHVDHHLRQFGA